MVLRGCFTLDGPAEMQIEALQKMDNEALEGKKGYQTVLDALNVLGKTPWRINNPVFDVMEEMWKRGGDECGLPTTKIKEPKPDVTSAYFTTTRFKFSNALLCTKQIPRQEAYKNYWIERLWKQRENERLSLFADFENKLKVARELKDEAAFYYPHNLDFRGRAYPMHPHLNHLGADNCRFVFKYSSFFLLK